MDIDLSNLKNGLVGAEALPPSLRQELAELGVSVLQGYGTADLGSVAYESKAIDGMILDEGVVVEPSPAKVASGRLSPVPAAPVTPPAVPSPPKSPPRELLEDQPPRPPCDDKNELDFDDCGRDPGPCAIARALSQLQSSVAPRRMVMV